MPGQPLFEVMSAQATSALVNGAPQGGGTHTAGYGSAERGPAETPAAIRPQDRSGAEQSEQTAVTAVPPTTSDVNGPEVPSSSNHLEGAGSATEGVLPASSGESRTRDGFPELQSGMQSRAQRAETATGLLDASTSAGLPDVGEDPGEFGVNRGFFTPRSRTSQLGGPSTAGSGYWPGWMTRIGELFAQPTAPAWMPSPIPSPPRPPTQLARRSLDLRTADDEGSLGFRLAGRTFATPPSSSVPAEAIQAEVQRQLGSLLDRLSVAEAENAKLQDALLRQRSLEQGQGQMTHESSTRRDQPAQDVRHVVSGHSTVSAGNPDHVPPAQEAPPRDPPRRAPGQGSSGDPWSAIWEGISGKFGSRARTSGSNAVVPTVPAAPKMPASSNDAPATTSSQPPTGVPNEILEALTQGMQQLQDLQLKAMKKDNDSGDSPEVVKTATVNLPELRPPLGETCGLVLQDWLVQVTTAMQDLSTTSGDWWEQVREKVGEAYSLWLEATPLERLQVIPTDHQKLSSGRWLRVNARACALMMQSFAEVVKADLIARRSTQSAVMVLFRLYTTYQPGGAAERAVVLRHLQGNDPPADVAACLDALRSWPRWLQRCKDMNMTVPDGSILARSLTTTANNFLGENQDAVFRTQLVRSTYRIDVQPKIEDVVRYQQHLQAEIVNIVISKTTSSGSAAAVKTITPAPTGSPSPSSPARPCKYFLKAGGCRRGGKCPFQHSLDGLSKVERSRKCLSCGSEEHRAKDCPTKSTRTTSTTRPVADKQQPSTPTSSASAPVVAKATVEPEGESSPQKDGPEAVLQGQPVRTWEALLHAAAKVAGTPPSEPKAPSLRVMSVHGNADGSENLEGAYALVDSGATHPLRKATSEEEWQRSRPVVVHLAGGEVVEMKMNDAGTLLVPATGSTRSTTSSPIVPLGSLAGVLGYRMERRGSRCRLISREGQTINLRVRDGCPEVTEAQALELISRIEEEKLMNLKDATVITEGRIRESVISMNKTWFDHLISYCRSGIGNEALKAIHNAPFLQELPQDTYAGLSEAAPIDNGWDALKGLKHLNRRTRKRLWSSSQWVVHLYAGKKQNEEVMFLERQGFVVLELDRERGRSHDVCDPLVWRALERGARSGRIVSVIGGPPQNTFMLKSHMSPGPEPLRSEEYPYGGWSGQSERDRALVSRHTGLFVKMIYLHALATAGRCVYPSAPNEVKEVGFSS